MAFLQTARRLSGASESIVGIAVQSRCMASGAVTKVPSAVGNTITHGAQAFEGDLRSTSGLGLGDGIENHTEKWMTGPGKSPMEYLQEAEPMQVHGLVVASTGSSDPGLGCPVEYIDLRGTTREKPAVCKYTGNKYWTDDWRTPGKLVH